MRYETSISFRLLRCIAAILIAGLLTEGSVAATAKSPDDLDIITVSTRPDTMSGGDVLVRINVPPGVAINDLIVLLNGQNIAGAFRPEAGRHSLLGLVDGCLTGISDTQPRTVPLETRGWQCNFNAEVDGGT
jgi:hypothetical protein